MPDEPVRNHSLEEPITQEPFSGGSWVIGFKQSDNGRRIFLLPPAIARLLNVDLSAGVFKLLLEVSSFSLGNSFLNMLRSAFNEVLSFLQAEAGDSADFLDDVDLVGASVNQDNVELGLFFFRSSSSSTAASSSNCYRSSSRNAPLLFEQLGKLSSFQNGQRGEVFYDLCEISPFSVPLIRFEPV